MTLQEMIYRRRSCRSFTNIPVEAPLLESIRAFSMKPLYPDIKVHWEIVPRNQVKCICPWTTPQLITVYSEEKEGWQENVGFLFQQMDLYLHSLGLGVCWLGLGKLKSGTGCTDMRFVIMLAFGYPKGTSIRQGAKDFKRKALAQIADFADERLEPARLAPSAVNSQPWYFTHEGDNIHIYCSKKGSPLDAGIALAHLYVANREHFSFFREADPPLLPGYHYIGSITL